MSEKQGKPTTDRLVRECRELLIGSAIRRARPWPVFGWFSICPVDQLLGVFENDTRNSAYRLLTALHCVHYLQIPKKVRQQIPELIREALAEGRISETDLTSLEK